MDISADITVFETLLKQEGFVEEEKREEAKNKPQNGERRGFGAWPFRQQPRHFQRNSRNARAAVSAINKE